MRFASAIICVIAVAHGLAQQREESKDNFVPTIASIKRSIAPVVCRGATGVASILGTGFFITPQGRFVTAAHVLDSFSKNPECGPGIYLPVREWSTETAILNVRLYNFELKRCVVDIKLDLADCRTSLDLTSKEVASVQVGVNQVTLDTDAYPDGTPIAFTGFPLQNVQPLSSIGVIAAYRPTAQIVRGQILLDKSGWPGVSGGPIYLVTGQVVGIVIQRGVNDGSGMTIGRPARLVADFIAANDRRQRHDNDRR